MLFLLFTLIPYVIFTDHKEYLTYSYGIVSEYIPKELSDKLGTQLGVEQAKPITTGKRKSSGNLTDQSTLKRLKSEENVSIIDMKPDIAAIKEKKATTKEKQMAKAASGTKSISSFFMKK